MGAGWTTVDITGQSGRLAAVTGGQAASASPSPVNGRAPAGGATPGQVGVDADWKATASR